MKTSRFPTAFAVLTLAGLALFALPQAGEAQCSSLCGDCGWWEVIVTDGQPHNSTKEIDIDCQLAPCTGMTCVKVEDEDDWDRMEAAASEDDLLAMVDIFQKDRNFILNARRGSLQLRSACNRGEVIANLPLSEFLFRELRVVAEEDQVILEE